jgi:hypothetical protein
MPEKSTLPSAVRGVGAVRLVSHQAFAERARSRDTTATVRSATVPPPHTLPPRLPP